MPPSSSGTASKGSQKWLQELVTHHCDLIDPMLKAAMSLSESESIEWLSPVPQQFSEYQDSAFLRQLGVEPLPRRTLLSFWPPRGPVWDGLARSTDGQLILLEAKSHENELQSPGSAAKSDESKKRIAASLDATKTHLGVDPQLDWSGLYYQYANRLAHLYLLRTLNGLPAWLVFLHFVGDEEMNGPRTAEAWLPAIEEAHGALGIPADHPLEPYVVNLFVDVADLRVAGS